MAMALMQQGSKGPMRDLDPSNMIYLGAANAEAKVGKSGAGTNWHNPNGHAFIRKNSGIPMSQRASRKAQLSGASSAMIAQQSAAALDRDRPSSRSRAGRPPPQPEGQRAQSRESGRSTPASNAGQTEEGYPGGGYAGGGRASSKDLRSIRKPPQAPSRMKSLN
eukprot:TRINITY_DN8686_c0_g1_i1.p2 TRINITY_DN8686_c0_g1~~TRINITY_DN8686_c0_g1_i1.p2  ORF type:complete len:185 (-),score=31.18 TRINITY_DN8686_c0_g1_i1:35-526(-)